MNTVNSISDGRNLTLLTDLYELTMMQGYFKRKEKNVNVIFDAFYRKNPDGNGYAISCGLEQLIELIEKSVENKTTVSKIKCLSGEESIDELARMLGGVEITEKVRESAREMKELAHQKKCH